MKNHTDIKSSIVEMARELGFLDCRVSKADFLEQEAPLFEKWLRNKKHGSMHYMENNFDKRLDPRLLVSGAKSIISLSYNYYPSPEDSKKQANADYKISKYAYGEDYHKVIKEKLKLLLAQIKQKTGSVSGRGFVDSAPILEKAWAKRNGLGWIGKNTNLISLKKGSFFFLAELILDIDLEPDFPVSDHCGRCTACIDACPTEALKPYEIDASKCISYLTIEYKEEIPARFSGKMDNWIFGCDICQDVCPWNRFSLPHKEGRFKPSDWLLMKNEEWESLTEETFVYFFSKSAIKRTKFTGLERNINFIK